jgi:O-antigen/teichoic acid export membrane protein
MVPNRVRLDAGRNSELGSIVNTPENERDADSLLSVLHQVLQLGRETLAYGLSSVIASVLGIFLVPLFTRVLSPADYGLVALVTAITGAVATFVVLGLDSAAQVYYFDDSDNDRRLSVMGSWFWCQLGVATAASVLIIVNASWLGPYISGSPSASWVLVLAALAVPLGAFRQVAGIWLRCNRMAWKVAGFFTASALASIVASAVMVLVFRLGVPGVFLGQLLGAVVTAVVGFTIIKRMIRLRHFSRRVLAGMLRFGLPLIPAALAGWITASSDRIILNIMVGETAVGLYSVAASVATVVALFTVAFQFAWGPFALSIVDGPRSREVLGVALSWFMLVSCFLAVTISIFAPEVLRLLTTPKFYAAASSVPYLTFSVVAMGVMQVVAIGAYVAKKSTIVAGSMFIGAAVNVALNFALIPLMGRDGAGAATLAAYLVAAIYTYFRSQRHFTIDYRIGQVIVIGTWSVVAVIGCDVFLPGSGVASLLLRGGVCASFVVLTLICGLVTPAHIRSMVHQFIG